MAPNNGFIRMMEDAKFKIFWQTASLLQQPRLDSLPAPIVVGALGGSGTRSLVYILDKLGIWMGKLRNENEDAIATRQFLEHHFASLQSGITPDSRQTKDIIDAFSKAIFIHRRAIPYSLSPWGWKNPRTMWLIPFLTMVFPGARFIHLVRDGRDMALSSNQTLLHKHGSLLLGEKYSNDPIVNQLNLWTLGNEYAITTGRQHLRDHFLTVRYEDICFDTRNTIKGIADFLDSRLTEESLEAAEGTVRPSTGVGRAKGQQTHPSIEQPPESFLEMLRHFGYETT